MRKIFSFIGRLIGIKRYQIFIVIDSDCWRRYKRGSFILFSSACKMADKLRRLEMSNDVEYAVATGRNDKQLYITKGNIY
jgi:hypothetical protein